MHDKQCSFACYTYVEFKYMRFKPQIDKQNYIRAKRVNRYFHFALLLPILFQFKFIRCDSWLVWQICHFNW